MPEFVIQRHAKRGQATHWDLMLEYGPVLKTFRLNRPPTDLEQGPTQAEPIFDHEKRFLTYQGPVNQGLGRVTIEEHGTYQSHQQSESRWEFTLKGVFLQGHFALIKTAAGPWELCSL